MINELKNKLLKPESGVVQMLKSLLVCLTSLADLTDKENKYIEQGQLESIKGIIEKKYEFVENLEKIEDLLAPYAGKLQDGEYQELLDKIKSANERLKELQEKNIVLLQSSIKVSEIMLKIQKEKGLQQAIRQFGYDNDGRISALKNLEKVVPSMSLNNKV